MSEQIKSAVVQMNMFKPQIHHYVSNNLQNLPKFTSIRFIKI